ncbi:MAG: TRAP transporter small permease [Rhodospirillaceae bacterium]|nr:TRAP transporter small permease [Rhodospirillaceae bacterium]
MNGILKTIDAICDAGAAVAGVLLLALFALGFAEVLMRDLFDISLSFAIEYGGYLLILVLFLGSGWTLRQGAHIRVNLLSARLSPAAQRALDIACTAVALVIAVFVAAAVVRYGLGTLARGTRSYFPSATPLAIPQLAFAVGPCILALALVARLIRLARGEAGDLGRPAQD